MLFCWNYNIFMTLYFVTRKTTDFDATVGIFLPV